MTLKGQYVNCGIVAKRTS